MLTILILKPTSEMKFGVFGSNTSAEALPEPYPMLTGCAFAGHNLTEVLSI